MNADKFNDFLASFDEISHEQMTKLMCKIAYDSNKVALMYWTSKQTFDDTLEDKGVKPLSEDEWNVVSAELKEDGMHIGDEEMWDSIDNAMKKARGKDWEENDKDDDEENKQE